MLKCWQAACNTVPARSDLNGRKKNSKIKDENIYNFEEAKDVARIKYATQNHFPLQL